MLEQLIHSARRRLLLNEALREFAWSAALTVAGLAVLLAAGTRYLAWWAVALFAGGVLVWAVVRLRRKIPTDYAAAVWLDEKAGLHDALSTAHHFSSKDRLSSGDHSGAEAILAAQRGQAESMANDVDVTMAVPFRFPKALYGLAALLLASTGLVGIRYFYGHTLNLSAPITEVIFQDLAAKPLSGKAARPPAKQKEFEEARSLLQKLGMGANLEDKPGENLDEALADALKSANKTPGDGGNASLDPNQKGDPMDSQDAPKSSPQSNNSQPGDGKKNGETGEQTGGASTGKSGEKSEKSLLSKLKDAMDNMMGAASPSGDKKNQGGKPQSKPDQSQASSQPGQAGDDENKATAEGEANGNAQKGNAKGQTSGNVGDKQEGPSAAGSEDGEKAVKAAAQMQAMGKISELIGKRSEQVTGESMIEVQSGDQKLQTAYKDKAATHGEGTGEVSRDEIPLSEQSYVQQYFQQVRKPGNAAPSPKTKK